MKEETKKSLRTLGDEKKTWRSVCKQLDNKDIDYLKEFAIHVGINPKDKTKKQLCMEISIQYEASWIPDFKTCKNAQISGKSFDNVNSYLIIRDHLGKCYSLEDLLIIAGNNSYDRNIEFEKNMSLEQAIDFLNKRHIQLEIDSNKRKKELSRISRKTDLPKSARKSTNVKKTCIEMLNGTLNDTNTGYIPNLSRLIKEEDIDKLTEDVYSDIYQVIYKYDMYNETELHPFVFNKVKDEFCAGLIDVFEYIRENEDFFNLDRIKNDIAKLVK